eukprot:3936875-Rhodomonas_salina.1
MADFHPAIKYKELRSGTACTDSEICCLQRTVPAARAIPYGTCRYPRLVSAGRNTNKRRGVLEIDGENQHAQVSGLIQQ